MKKGKTQGFFECRASEKEIEAELPSLRSDSLAPSQLELSVNTIESKGNSNSNRYVVEATLPNATNEETSREVAGVLIQGYQSPLYEQGDPFRGSVVYEEDGRPVYRE